MPSPFDVVEQMLGGGSGEELTASLEAQCAQGNTEACRQLAAMVQHEREMQFRLAQMEEERRRRELRARGAKPQTYRGVGESFVAPSAPDIP